MNTEQLDAEPAFAIIGEDMPRRDWLKARQGGIGGSDSHIVSHIGRCATRFPRPIADENDLAAALLEGGFEAITWT